MNFFFDVVSQLSEGFLTLGFSPSIHNHQESSRSSGTPHSSSGPHNTNRITHPKPITIFLSIDSTVRWMEVISYDMVWHDFLTLDYDVFFPFLTKSLTIPNGFWNNWISSSQLMRRCWWFRRRSQAQRVTTVTGSGWKLENSSHFRREEGKKTNWDHFK